MQKRPTARLLTAVLACAMAAGCGLTSGPGTTEPSSMTTSSYPRARKVDQVDEFHGVKVADPYRWMEDPNSPELRDWINAQNAVTQDFLKSIPQRDAIHQRIRESVNYARRTNPDLEGGKFYHFQNSGLQDHSVLVQSDIPCGDGRVIIDPNLWPADEARSLRGQTFSRDGKLMAYSTSLKGSDWSEWRVRDVASNTDLPDLIQHTKTGGVSWDHGGKGFWYARHEVPKAGEEYVAANALQTVWYHRLGTPQSDDVLVYSNPAEGHIRPWIGLTEDGRWLVLWLFDQTKQGNTIRAWDAGGVLGVDIDPPSAKPDWGHLAGNDGHNWGMIGNDGSTFYFETNHSAPRGRVVALDARDPDPARAREIVPHRADAIDSVEIAGNRLVVRSQRDCCSVVELWGLDGTKLSDVKLPGAGTASGFDGNREDAVRYFSYTDNTTPQSVFSLDTRTGAVAAVWQPEVPGIDLSQFESKLEFFTNRDGLRVTLFVSHRKDLRLDGSNPTVLYGYGGFNNSIRPGFSASRMVWLGMGGVFVHACLRGDGNYGEAWHRAAGRINKQRTFDDFIGAAEWLIARGYTSPKKLAIQGGSNGGLLVGACMNQRPELFGACIPAVGVMDMLRFHKFTVGAGWIREYGSPEDPLEFQVLHAISPYHQLKPGVKYPPTLVVTSDHDDRVVPAHSFKYAARLQECNGGDNPTLIRIQTKGGHGGSTRLSESLEQAADQYAFLVRALGMEKATK